LPLASVAYFPAASFLHHENLSWKMGLFSPLIGLIFLFLACKFWKRGVSHYTSTGS
jgi:ABC-type uncharacterized transport system permease subunit